MGIGKEIIVLYAAVKPILRKMYLNSYFSLQTRVFLYYTPPYVSFTKYREQMKGEFFTKIEKTIMICKAHAFHLLTIFC